VQILFSLSLRTSLVKHKEPFHLTNLISEYNPALTKLLLGREQANIYLIVTDNIIDKILTHFAEQGIFWRNNALNLYQRMKTDRNMEIIHVTLELRKQGFTILS